MSRDANNPDRTSAVFARLPDSDQDFDVTAVNPNAESTRMDGAHSHPQDGHMPHHARPKADDMDQHVHQVAPGDLQGPYIGHSRSPAS